MPLSSLLLVLATCFGAPGRDTGIQIPASTQTQLFAPADSQWQHLVELDKTHKTARSVAIGTALGGGGLITIAVLAWTFDGLIHTTSSPSSNAHQDRPLQTLEAWTGGLGAACELVAIGSATYSHVLSNRIEAYEHKTRYRLSLEPAILPSERALGMVARVGF